MRGGRDEVRNRMLQSLVDSQHDPHAQGLRLRVLLQSCDSAGLAAFAAAAPPWVSAVAIAGRVPLSLARNVLLRNLLEDGSLGPDALVAFPDDDCWYPGGFLGQVASLFCRDPTLDFWFCRYASQPREEAFASVDPVRATTAEIVRNASSNTIFLRGRVVRAVGDFDEALGVGTPLGGSEDLDYALRAGRLSRKTTYRNAALVGHRDKSPGVRARYYASSLLVLARHARHGARAEFLRKLAVGAYLTMRRELAVREFVRSLRSVCARGSGIQAKSPVDLGEGGFSRE